MSIGPMGGLPASVAGLPTAQAKGSEVDRGPQELAAGQRQAYHAQKAADAANVGQTDGEDHETADRDADGRLAWMPADTARRKDDHAPPRSRDATGQSGNFLDLTG
jgi:hypothetical protein